LPTVVSSVELDVGSLPLVVIPPPIPLSARPAQLPAEDAAGITLVNPHATTANPGGQVLRANGEKSSQRVIEKSLSLPTSITARDATSGQEKIAVNCHSTGTVLALRWETFSIRPDGGALWAIHDGWFDPVACRIAEQRQLVVQPRALALLSDQPVAFAVRTAEGLVILYPTLEGVLADAMTGPVKPVHGPISRVLLPLARGASATVVSGHNLQRTAAWLSNAEGKGVGSVSLGNGVLNLRVEVTQTVSEDSPTLLLNLRAGPSG
jgi:hypothetical protein